ncbi:Protein N-acetyltransferase, RimJ/RimL family [Clostridium collagenovorans DSM 3089]|uniref:Protein N-acetyltransferase, RimJ/RimL family n=1 Tax=Clostridium collagenovorans DSM 3089 TaxID=1121306 RepID=A0A1M5S7X2_9CLOT|nr:GNAT family N-acetyltransferase [Clostridium collagenovorans]SHH34545.1 Protein N-acetyltransferase, RimJ/RimL family [Clostridium collagenovorans DSM 3089]
MILQGKRIFLAPYTLERCHEFFKDYVSDPAMTYNIYTYDKEKVDRYYEKKVLDTSRLFFAICYNDKTIGEIQIKQIDKENLSCTLSIHLINDAFKGKGYGTEAQQLLIDYAINTLGFKIIHADAVHRNLRSIHILEKLGFKHLYDDDTFTYYKFSAE